MQSERSTDAFRTLEARAHELKEAEAHRDPLTGLHDCAWFDRQLSDWFRQASENRSPLTVMLADIDGLQAINQAHGRGEGDKVILSVASSLRRRLRPRDLVARHAGGTFTILLPRALARAGRAVAERLRAGVAEENHVAAETPRVTLSVGCVTFERTGFASRQQIMEAATRALSAAKRDGRDRVVFLVDSTGESLDRPAPAV